MKIYFAIICMLAMLSSCDSDVGQIGSEVGLTDSDNPELLKNINSIVNTPLIKGELETTEEFNGRVKKQYEKYSNKNYKVKIKITNLRSGDLKHNLYTSLNYNADTSELTFSLPELERNLFYYEKNGEKRIVFISSSFIQTEPTVKDHISRREEAAGRTHPYYGLVQNGIAVLGEGLRSFRVNIARDKVREIYDNGMIVLNVKTDLQFLTESNLGRYDPVILFTNERKNHEGRTIKEISLPVRLISVELYNSKGNLVIKEQIESEQMFIDRDRDSIMSKGERAYNNNCAACHQTDGAGIPGVFPAMTGSAIATGDVAGHIDIVVNGKAGTAMQAFGEQLSAEDLAAIITYERNAFGNDTGDIVNPSIVHSHQNHSF